MDKINNQRLTWTSKKVLRLVYSDIHSRINNHLISGSVLEVGCGAVTLKENIKSVIATDLQCVSWVDISADAHNLPFKDEVFANVAFVDTLHHLRSPINFLKESTRVISVGGRIVMSEPVITPISRVMYKYFHEERLDFDVDIFSDDVTENNPYDSNQAIPTMLHRNIKRLKKEIPNLKFIERNIHGVFVYPMSGGFRRWSLLPSVIVKPLLALEKSIEPFIAPFCGFRQILVFEKL